MALASMCISLIGAIIFFYPFPGMLLTLLGIALGITAKKQRKGNRRFATAGIVLNAIFFCSFILMEIAGRVMLSLGIG